MPDLYGYELFESCDLHDSYCFLLKKQFFLLLQAEKSVRVLFYKQFAMNIQFRQYICF